MARLIAKLLGWPGQGTDGTELTLFDCTGRNPVICVTKCNAFLGEGTVSNLIVVYKEKEMIP